MVVRKKKWLAGRGRDVPAFGFGRGGQERGGEFFVEAK